MLPASVWRPQVYPPRGPFPQFGDETLQQTMSATEQAYHNLTEKRQTMQDFHDDNLHYHGLKQPEPKQESTEYYDIGEETANSGTQTDGPTYSSSGSQTEKPRLAQMQGVAGSYEPPPRKFVNHRGVVYSVEPSGAVSSGTQTEGKKEDTPKQAPSGEADVGQPQDGVFELSYPQAGPSSFGPVRNARAPRGSPLNGARSEQEEQLTPADGVLTLTYPQDQDMASRSAPKRPGDSGDDRQSKKRNTRVAPVTPLAPTPAPTRAAPTPAALAPAATPDEEQLVPLDGIMQLPYPSSSSSNAPSPPPSQPPAQPPAQHPGSRRKPDRPPDPPVSAPAAAEDEDEEILVPQDGVMELPLPVRRGPSVVSNTIWY